MATGNAFVGGGTGHPAKEGGEGSKGRFPMGRTRTGLTAQK